VRLVEDQPRDWNTGNLLGDLYVRGGQLDQAVAQFARIADSLHHEGFNSKAAALYKKILKLRPDDDRALVQTGLLAAEQGLLADARLFLTTAATGRRSRGDHRGALQLTVRIGALDPHDVPARIAAAHALHELGDLPAALHDLTELANWLVEVDREDEAVAPLREVAALDPGGHLAPRELARILVKQGRLAEAAPFLTAETIGGDPALMLVAADARLRTGDTNLGFELVDTLLATSAASAPQLAEVAEALAADHPDTAFALIDRIVSVRIADGDWAAAADALRRFVSQAPGHLPALARLVDVCVDGGLQPAIFEAQGLLADAYLATGAASEAKYVAEDLLTRQPWEPAHFARLRAALEACGEADPDRALADWLAGTPAFGLDEEFHAETTPVDPAAVAGESGAPALFESDAPPAVPEPAAESEPSLVLPDPWTTPVSAGGVPRADQPPSPPVPPPVKAGRANPHEIDLDLIFGQSHGDEPAPPPKPAPPATIEEDLSGAIDTIPSQTAPVPAAASAPPDLESVFATMREQAAHRSPDDAAEMAYARGVALIETGHLEQGAEQLRLAMRSPARRFASASRLARAYQDLGRTADAIEWLSHAVDAAGVTPTDRFDTLYRMADLLETTGETASALAICLELQADAGDFRDVSDRIARLSRAQAGG